MEEAGKVLERYEEEKKNPRPKRRRSSGTPLEVLFMGEGEFFRS